MELMRPLKCVVSTCPNPATEVRYGFNLCLSCAEKIKAQGKLKLR